MTPTFRLAATAAAILFLAACGGGGGETPSPTAAPTRTPASTPTDAPGVARGRVGEGAALRSRDGSLEIRSGAKAALDVVIRETQGGAPAPKGWTLLSPVYDITAKDRDREVIKLADPFELRFKVSGGYGTVMYYDGRDWVIVESESDGAGAISAKTDHLTPYAVAKPTSQSAPTAKSSPTAEPSSTRPAASTTVPAGTPGGTPAASPLASVSATVAPVDPAAAAKAVQAAVEKYRGKSTKVTGAAGYTGSASLALPPAMQSAIDSATVTATLYYGAYGGVNAALTTGGAVGPASGSLDVLIEARTIFPANSTDAQKQLAEIFPGATGRTYQPLQTSGTTYAFLSASPTIAYVLGYQLYDGVAIAYCIVGIGPYLGIGVLASK